MLARFFVFCSTFFVSSFASPNGMFGARPLVSRRTFGQLACLRFASCFLRCSLRNRTFQRSTHAWAVCLTVTSWRYIISKRPETIFLDSITREHEPRKKIRVRLWTQSQDNWPIGPRRGRWSTIGLSVF